MNTCLFFGPETWTDSTSVMAPLLFALLALLGLPQCLTASQLRGRALVGDSTSRIDTVASCQYQHPPNTF